MTAKIFFILWVHTLSSSGWFEHEYFLTQSACTKETYHLIATIPWGPHYAYKCLVEGKKPKPINMGKVLQKLKGK